MKFVKKEYKVEEPELKAVYKIGQAKRGWKFDPLYHNIFFIGPRGSGKTTLAKKVAEELNMKFVDTDDEIVNISGMDIEKFVKKKGWEEFRILESSILSDICKKKGQVCATGGGIILREKNRELLKKSGFVFYLMGDVITFEKRILMDKENKNRPPLSNMSLRDELICTLREREPLYLSTAHFILRADKEIDELKEEVLLFIGVKGARL